MNLNQDSMAEAHRRDYATHSICGNAIDVLSLLRDRHRLDGTVAATKLDELVHELKEVQASIVRAWD